VYKKINYILIVVWGSFCGAFGMEREHALIQLMRKEVIPVLALNDYVAPVSNAYDALKREACMPYESIEKKRKKRIKQIVRCKRTGARRDGAWIYTIHTEKAHNKLIRQTGNIYCRQMEIICTPSLTHPYAMSADISKTTFLYNDCGSSLLTRQCWTQDKQRIERVNFFLQAMVMCTFSVLPKRQVFCIEIRSPYKVSDWITIQNLYDPNIFFTSQELQQENNVMVEDNNSVALHESDIDLLAMDMHAQERFSYIVIAVFTVLSRAMLSHFFY
jgi:hypothetical protein